MFGRIRNYFYERRQVVAKLAGFAGACYLVGEYAYGRLQDMREVLRQTQAARENLRRRFHQNQFDASVTTLDFLPHLADGIMKEMDVETLTEELRVQTEAAKARGRAHRAPSPEAEPVSTTSSHEPAPTESSLASSVEVVHRHDISPAPQDRISHGPAQASSHLLASEHPFGHDTDSHSDVISISGTSANGTENSRDLDSPISIGLTMASSPSISSQAPSWVEGYDSQLSAAAGPSHELTMPTTLHQHPQGPTSSSGSPRSNAGANLSDSYMSDSYMSTSASASASDVEYLRTRASETDGSRPSTSQPRATNSGQRKAEIWRELKILALTRTLTVIYSATLYALLMHVLISMIGRAKYVHSIVQQVREAKIKEIEEEGVSLSSLLFNYGFGFGIGGGPLAGLMGQYDGIDDALNEEERMRRWVDEDLLEVPELSVENEERVLRLNWWLLRVGWKDVSERVHKEVDAVFRGLSLRTELTPMEFHKHICDVRRRIEHEVTYEGVTRRVNFLSSLLPQTAETLNLCLQRGRPTKNAFTSASTSLSASTLTSSVYQSQSQSGFVPSTSPYVSTSISPNPSADPVFASFLTEARSHILSQTFASTLNACLDRATEFLVEDLKKSGVFEGSEVEGTGEGGGVATTDTGEGKVRLAKLIHALGRWSKDVLRELPNRFIESISDVREVSVLSATIFAQFDNSLH